MTKQRGFTLVSAIFLMVVLVVLGTSLMTLSSVQHATAAQQLQTARAQYAARVGVEWAGAAAANPAGCPAVPTTLAPGSGLEGFLVTVTCSRSDHTLGTAAAPQRYYVVDVTATAGAYGGPDYVRRRLQTKILGPAP